MLNSSHQQSVFSLLNSEISWAKQHTLQPAKAKKTKPFYNDISINIKYNLSQPWTTKTPESKGEVGQWSINPAVGGGQQYNHKNLGAYNIIACLQ